MILPEPEYISMQEACRRFDVSLEDIINLAEKELLSVFVRESKAPYRYARIKSPRWVYGTLDGMNCPAEYEGYPSEFLYVVGFECDKLLIKPLELRKSCQKNVELDQYKMLNQASQILRSKRNEERDALVEKIMKEIELVIKQKASQKDTNHTFIINHLRFITEANVPEKLHNPVRKKVVECIRKTYGHIGFKALSRAPKKSEPEPYLLPS